MLGQPRVSRVGPSAWAGLRPRVGRVGLATAPGARVDRVGLAAAPGEPGTRGAGLLGRAASVVSDANS